MHPRQRGEFEFVDVVPAGGVRSVDALGLVEPVGRLGQGIVVGVGHGPDRGTSADLLEPLGESHRGELRPGIRMRHQPDEPVPATGRSGHLQSVEDHLGLHVRCDPPADDPSTERVDDEAHIRHPRPGRNVGQIRHPQRVGPVGLEVPVDQVRRSGGTGILLGREHLLPKPGHALDSQPPHQPGDLVPADVVARALGGLPQLVGPVDLPVRDPQRHQDLHHDQVTDRTGRRSDLPLLRGVIAARSHLQVPADELDSELSTVLVDERDDHFKGRSSSAAKKAEARFSRSLARRSSRFSCSNSLMRFASTVVRPSSTPSSMSACLTQVRSDSTPQPIWSATRWTVPCVVPSSLRSCRTSRTALAFSSGEYRRVVGFPDVLLVPMAPSSFPRSGASKQPRVVQTWTRSRHRQRHFTPDTISRSLRRAGLASVGAYGLKRTSPLDPATEHQHGKAVYVTRMA
ncbi:hypothetical protein BN13_1060002 [Nostocoides jenkinsii Ben 74]|uniref:Uncharacterized protein n=1 Tax=Nostocoides jenkinsii Ben 74 TaxID=1193518 RepID=A0A077M4N1_9MICO|nr:hypothetical protein BN13_1060002 [Tetrasphaera jenkinsii Ben 74]